MTQKAKYQTIGTKENSINLRIGEDISNLYESFSTPIIVVAPNRREKILAERIGLIPIIKKGTKDQDKSGGQNEFKAYFKLPAAYFWATLR